MPAMMNLQPEPQDASAAVTAAQFQPEVRAEELARAPCSMVLRPLAARLATGREWE